MTERKIVLAVQYNLPSKIFKTKKHFEKIKQKLTGKSGLGRKKVEKG